MMNALIRRENGPKVLPWITQMPPSLGESDLREPWVILNLSAGALPFIHPPLTSRTLAPAVLLTNFASLTPSLPACKTTSFRSLPA